MGCCVSQEVSEAENKPKTVSSRPSPKTMSKSVESTGGTMVEPLPLLPRSSADPANQELRPEQLIVWKLHTEISSPLSTLSALELIKDTACLDLGVRKCKVSLFGLCGPQQLWLKTASGAFSPGMTYKDTVMGELFDAFQDSGGQLPTVLVYPDLRLVPRLKDHPSVVERPHIVFTAAALLVTQTRAGRSHAMGLFTLWDSVAHKKFTKEQEAKLVVAAAATRAALQRQLFTSLGMDPVGLLTGNQPPELPAVWIDRNDPVWRVLGINASWKSFTGVGLQELESFDGLLKVMVSSDGTDAATVRYMVDVAVAKLPLEGTLALILSPLGPKTGLMQFVMALRRADTPPPLPASGNTGTAAAGVDSWIIEIHASLQANDYRTKLSLEETPPPSVPGTDSRDGSEYSVASVSMPTPRPHRAPILASITTPSIPPRMASLHVGQILGTGSYANVYAGRLGDRPVAIKIIRHAYGPDYEKADWLDHYEALSNVDNTHDNILATLDWARMEDVGGCSIWILEELADQGSLSAAIGHGLLCEGQERGALADERAILATARDIARGMRYLHSMGEIHGDLSSNNVMLASAENSRGFVAKVSDFGLSRLEAASVRTQTIGTVSHMAPELLVEGKTSKSTDVFSFGVILWEMWTGKRAWAGMSMYQVIFATSCKGERIKMPSDAPEDYAKLTMDCLAPNRDDRPTFNDIVPRLDMLLSKLVPPPQPPFPSPRGHPILSED